MIVLVVLVVAAGPAARMVLAQERPGSTGEWSAREETHLVRPGETLWSIAGSVAPEGADLRPVVDAIAARNGVAAGGLVPGQALVIPAEP